MKSEMFLDYVAKTVQKRPKTIIIVVLLITILGSVFLRDVPFETDITVFFPENEEVAANRRMEDYFGKEDFIHMIEVTSKEPEGVLEPLALREQYNITLKAREVEGVVETQSVAEIVNLLCHYIPRGLSGYTYNESRTILNTPPDEIQGRLNLLRSLMKGDETLLGMGGGQSNIDPDIIRFSVGLLLSSDFNVENFTASRTIILVELDGRIDLTSLRSVVGEVKEEVASLPFEHVTERETSQYFIAHEMQTTLIPTMALLGVAILSIITIILVGSFRHFSYVWAPLLTLVIAIAWTFATMVALGFVFSILEVAVIPLIVGLGVDYSVHISKRYQEGLAENMSISDSMGNSIRKVGAALFLAFITTVIAFLSNVVSDIGPIRSFGIMCAIGITYAYLLAITFYPSLRIVIDERRGGKATEPKPTERIDKLMRKTANLVEERPRPIMIITLVLVIGSLYAASLVPVEFNMEAFLPQDWESVSTIDSIQENFEIGGLSATYVLIEAKEDEDLATPVFLSSVYETTRRMEDSTYVVRIRDTSTGNYSYFIESVADMISRAVRDNSSLAMEFALDENGRPLPECSDEDVRGLFHYLSTHDDPYDSLRNLTYSQKFSTLVFFDEMSGRYTASVIIQQVTMTSDEQARTITNEALDSVAGFEGGEVSVTGGVVLVQAVLDGLTVSQVYSTIVSVLFALVVLIIIYRSTVLGFVSITPVVVAMSLSLGSMWLLGISLNALTIMITALTIGLGVDYAVHFVERFREEEKEHKPSEALHRTLENTGAALLISALTTMFGFGILVIAGIPIFTDFGLLTAVMIAYSLIAAVVVTPVILMWMARRKWARKALNK